MKWSRGVWLAVLVGCGGGGGGASEPTEPREPEPRAYEFVAQWDALSQRLCEKLTACAFEDAEKSLPPEEVTQLREAGPIHTRECAREYRKAEPTKRQLDGISQCLDDHSGCEPLLECMDRAGAPAPG